MTFQQALVQGREGVTWLGPHPADAVASSVFKPEAPGNKGCCTGLTSKLSPSHSHGNCRAQREMLPPPPPTPLESFAFPLSAWLAGSRANQASPLRPQVEFANGEDQPQGLGELLPNRQGCPCLAWWRGLGLDALRAGPFRPGLDFQLCETRVMSSDVMDVRETSPESGRAMGAA